jgi:hypothetical protein
MCIEDDIDAVWAKDLAREWMDELQDARQDIYTLDDGQPAIVGQVVKPAADC